MPENPVRSVLEGKPFRHPLHPMLVHFPIGLFVISLVLDVASYLGRGSHALVLGALYTMCAGVAMGIVAAVPGFVDWTDIRRDHPAKGIGQWHMGLNILVLLIYGISIIARFATTNPRRTDLPLIFTSVIAICVLMVSGYLGGLMVYDDGIGVGRHRRRGRAPVRTIPLTAAGSADGWVSVPGAELMEDPQTLRLSIDGVIVALAKADGAYYAFQEFCTHRYGPLSEGCLKGGQVTCPWHGSLFDLHTGKVQHGPAKTNINVYDVRLVNGKVSIRVPSDDSINAVRRSRVAGATQERDWKTAAEPAPRPARVDRTPDTR
ncbi:MAG: Rieske (2Fe-2S) domain protein [Phycisphaerales bacterium]|nr:Rieske (2Fe-2S) domain protein [Phycisphaerales bacterium]